MHRNIPSNDTFGQVLFALGICYFIVFISAVLYVSPRQAVPRSQININTAQPSTPIVDELTKTIEEIATNHPPEDIVAKIENAPDTDSPEVQAMLKADELASHKPSTIPIPEKIVETRTPTISTSDSTCTVDELGISFHCDLITKTGSRNAAGYILSEDPFVTVNWEKPNVDVHFLGQVNKFFIEDMGLYSGNFITENARFAGYNAIAVKGYDKNNPTTQRRDYFYLHNQKLVNVSFKLAETDKLDEGKMIIQQATSSFTPAK